MKYIFFVFGLLLSASVYASVDVVKEFYVSQSGEKGNIGSTNSPFCSLFEARQAIRAYQKKERSLNRRPKNIIVWIGKGVYELTESFELTEEDSGVDSCTISYQAYPREKVILTGARLLPANLVREIADYQVRARIVDRTVVDSIKSINLKDFGISDFGENKIRGFRRPYVNAPMELFINGNPYFLSRYPNKSQIRIKPGDVTDSGVDSAGFYPGKIHFSEERLAKWTNAKNIFACGNFKYAWATDQLRVKDFSPQTGEVSFADAHMYGISGEKEWNQYYFFNLLEELDQPGEYYVDQQQGELYFYPIKPLKSSDTIMVSVLEDALISLKGASNIRFRNLTIEGGRGIGVYMENTNSNRIENCTIRNLGVVGVCIGKGSLPSPIYRHPDEKNPFYPQEKLSGRIGSLYDCLYENPVFDRDGGKDNGIVNCVIENTGCGGISLGGGNRQALEKAGNYIFNCEFRNCGRLDYSYKSPVNIDGVGNKVQHCKFNSCPATAIYIHGNNHLIEYNIIEGACKFMDDQGAIYIGRDPSEFGNIIRFNFLKDIGNLGITMGVYFDDGACGTQLYGNVFYNAGTHNILVGGGQFNKIENNIFIHSELAIYLDNRLENWAKNSLVPDGIFEKRLKLMNHQKAPFASEYPEMVHYLQDNPAIPKHNDIQNNVFFLVKQIHSGKSEWGPVHENNLITDVDPGFKNPDKLDFTLKRNSVVFDMLPEFQAIPFDEIGRLH